MQHKHPFPWWFVTDCQALRTATGGVYRATVVLAISYWAAGCHLADEDDVTLARLTCLPIPTWRSHKQAAWAAFQSVRTRMDAAFAKAEGKAAKRRPYAAHARSCKKLNASATHTPVIALSRLDDAGTRNAPSERKPTASPISHGLFRE